MHEPRPVERKTVNVLFTKVWAKVMLYVRLRLHRAFRLGPLLLLLLASPDATFPPRPIWAPHQRPKDPERPQAISFQAGGPSIANICVHAARTDSRRAGDGVGGPGWVEEALRDKEGEAGEAVDARLCGSSVAPVVPMELDAGVRSGDGGYCSEDRSTRHICHGCWYHTPAWVRCFPFGRGGNFCVFFLALLPLDPRRFFGVDIRRQHKTHKRTYGLW